MTPKYVHLYLIVLTIAILIGLRFWKTPAAPEVHLTCETTKGPIGITVYPDWSPRGAERFLQLVDDGHFTGLPLFRCMAGFLCQFGAKIATPSTYTTIPDDPHLSERRRFQPGYLSFAGYGENSRTSHVFIALAAVPSLGSQPWETAFAAVDAASMAVVHRFETAYGDSAPSGRGPEPRKIEAADGAAYLKNGFPNLDYFVSCKRD